MANINLTDEQIEFLVRTCCASYAMDERDIRSENGIHSTIAAEVIGALLYQRKNFTSSFGSMMKQCSLSEPINKKLFMGAGNHSIIALNKLHKRLQYAAHQLGALEQNGGMGTEFDEKLEKDCKDDIVSVIKDIMYAFDISKEDL